MTNITQAAVSMIRPSSTNPRKNFDKTKLEELGRSILEKGMIQPLVVRFIAGTGPGVDALECVVGERRLKAAKLAGLQEVPVIIQALTDVAVLELQTIENLQREDLTEIEEADGYAQLMELAAYEVDGILARFEVYAGDRKAGEIVIPIDHALALKDGRCEVLCDTSHRQDRRSE